MDRSKRTITSIAVTDNGAKDLLELVHLVTWDRDSDSVGLGDSSRRDGDRRSDDSEDGGGTHCGGGDIGLRLKSWE